MAHAILLKSMRENYLDCCYWGSYYLANENKIILQNGLSLFEICFLRSLFKPIQASILFDYPEIIEKYKLEPQEIAIFAGSHAGSPKHIKVLENILSKTGLAPDNLDIEPLEPLDKREFNGNATKLHNNCSAKHILMALLSKELGFNFDYCNPSHPLQEMIKKRQEELSAQKCDILTYDGCGTPLWGITIKSTIKMFFNFLHDEKFKPMIDAVIQNPQTYGGFNRFDSEIIELGEGNLFSKVGAGGFVLTYNKKEDKILLVKMAQDNNNIRRLVTLDILNKLGWVDREVEKFIYNQKNKPVAKYCYEFSL